MVPSPALLVVAWSSRAAGVMVLAGSHREAYTPTGWNRLQPLPHEANAATACVLNGRLYVMGGINSNKLQVLECQRRRVAWTVKADLPPSGKVQQHMKAKSGSLVERQ